MNEVNKGQVDGCVVELQCDLYWVQEEFPVRIIAIFIDTISLFTLPFWVNEPNRLIKISVVCAINCYCMCFLREICRFTNCLVIRWKTFDKCSSFDHVIEGRSMSWAISSWTAGDHSPSRGQFHFAFCNFTCKQTTDTSLITTKVIEQFSESAQEFEESVLGKKPDLRGCPRAFSFGLATIITS